jgi:drug/metabolite transporter (DMT)-like permease
MVAVPAALSLPADAPSGDAAGSVLILGVCCTALAYWLFYGLVAEVGPGRAAVITYVAPAVAVLAGVALLGESLDALGVAGLLLVLAGSWLSTGGRPPALRRAGAAPARRPVAPGG